MFGCCCPSKDEAQPQLKEKSLQQKLINKEARQPEIVTGPPKQAEDEGIKEIPINKNLQKMNDLPQINPSNSESKSQSEQSSSQVKNGGRSLIKFGSFEQPQKMGNKSEIWQQEAGTKMLYFNNRKEEEMVFVFKIIHIRTSENNPLAYTLNPSKNIHKIRMKAAEVSLGFVIWNRTVSETKAAIKNIESDSHIKTIYGVYRKDQEGKAVKAGYQNDDINEIVMIGSNCIRLEVFDKIIISCLQEKEFQLILSFCQKITEFYELDDYSKVIFLLPPHLTLAEIHLLLSKLLRRHLISEKLESIIKFLGFHVELVEGEVMEPFMVVKSSLVMCQQEEVYSKEFEIKLELAIGLLMIEINYNNFKAYEKVLDSFFLDMTIIKYLKNIQFVHKEKREFLSKLEELKLFEGSQLVEIQNSSKIEEKIINPNEKCIVIKHRIKKRMGELFTDYKTAQTPIEESEKKKKEWDDDLKENDIRVTQVDKTEEIHENCNIFEAIDDSEVDSASLDIIANIEFTEAD